MVCLMRLLSGHDDEGQVVEEPPNNGVEPGVVDLVDIVLGKLLVAALPSDQVPGDQGGKDTQAGGRAPVDQRVAEQEVLCDLVVPAAHPKSDMEEGPLPPLRGEVVLFVGIGNKSVVGSHHGNVLRHG